MSGKSTILFEALSNVLATKSEAVFKKHTEDEEAWKTFSKFILLRYLTMSPNPAVRNLVIDRYLRLERMPDKALYRWLLVNIPQQRNGYIKYLK